MNLKNIRLVCIFVGVALLVLIPCLAGFPWSRFDFVSRASCCSELASHVRSP
jgi:hypothetical protein